MNHSDVRDIERTDDMEGAMLIRQSGPEDFEAILAIINDAAQAYRGVIPGDRWHDPYMPRHELEK